MRASRPLEVTVAVYPTLVLTNALPYDMDIVVWQVMLRPCLCCTAMLPEHIQDQDLLSHSRTVCTNTANISPAALHTAVYSSWRNFMPSCTSCSIHHLHIQNNHVGNACAILHQPAYRTITLACMGYAVSASRYVGCLQASSVVVRAVRGDQPLVAETWWHAPI